MLFRAEPHAVKGHDLKKYWYNLMIDDTNSSLVFYPSNKTISIGDNNTNGINIATGGAAFATNTINIGNTNSSVNMVDTGLNIKYVDQGVTANNISLGYNGTNYTTTGGEYSVSIWGGTNDWGGGTLNIPCVLQPYTKYKMTFTCRSTQSDMTFSIENPSLVTLYTSPVLTTTYNTYTFTFTNGEVASGSTFILRYKLASSVAVSGKSIIWNNAKVESLCVGVGVTPSYPLDVLGNIRSSGGIYSTGTSTLGAWGFNTASQLFNNCLGTQLPVTHSNYALYQVSGTTFINTTGYIGFRVNNEDKMIMLSNGNVGIGTTTPTTYKLDVNGTAHCSGDLYVGTNLFDGGATGATVSAAIHFAGTYGDSNFADGGGIYSRRYSTTAGSEQSELLVYKGNDSDDRVRIKGGYISFDTGTPGTYDSSESVRMTIAYNGYVGIGTTSPSWPLHIASNNTGSYSAALYGYHHAAGGWLSNGGGIWDVSGQGIGLKVDNGIISKSIYIMSDRRIKTDIIDLDDDEALIKFRQLKPKKYSYKDTLKYGNTPVYGFIAQEVLDVIPNSCSMLVDYIPNIMCVVKISLEDASSCILTMPTEHELLVNDIISCRDSKYNIIDNVTVTEVIDLKTIKINKVFKEEETTFVDETGYREEKLIFVYGKKVDNFHTLDKNAIWTVATAALQEVDRQLQDTVLKHQLEKEKTTLLQEQVQSLQSKYDSLESNYQQLLQRILALESKTI